jgi:hypothetical protein
MTTWVLILTIVFGDGASSSSIPGFKSKASCQKAGREWITQTGKNDYLDSQDNLTFVCVENFS